MAKVPYTVTWTEFFPTLQQSVLMAEIVQSTYWTYCWVMDGLAAGKWDIDEENMLDVMNTSIRTDWINNRPQGLCPMVMMKYLHREACHNWLDCGKDVAMLPRLKEQHKERFFMPASGHHIEGDGVLYVSAVGYIHVTPVALPGRMYLIIGHQDDAKWKAEIRTALS